MNSGKNRLGLISVIGVLLLTLVFSACAPAPPVKQETESAAKVGLRTVFTGPLATTGVPFWSGAMDFYKYTNDHGGYHGIKFDALWEEGQGLVPKEMTAHRRFKDRGALVELAFSSSPMETLALQQQKDELPLLGVNAYTESMVTEPPIYTFLCLTSWAATAAGFMKWAKDNQTES